MKKYLFILLMSMTFLMGMPNQEVAARSFDITNYDVLVDIQEDGSAFFTERITYDFDGEYNGVLYNLDISTIEEPTDVKVSMQAEGQQNAFPFAPSTSAEAGTFSLENTEDFLEFTVYNPMQDEIQTVIYEYRIPEIITNYNDVAELNRKIIGGSWVDPIENINIRITLPKTVSEGQLRAWGHGDRSGEVTLQDNQVVSLTLPHNPTESFVEARVIFPPKITQSNPHVVKEDKYDEIMAFEEKLAVEKETKGKQNLLLGLLFGILGPLFTLSVFIWLRKKDREANPNPIHVPDHIYELPADMTPAVMNAAVFNKAAGATEVTATIMDLIRKGYLKIEEIETIEQRKLFGKDKSNFRLYLQKNPDEYLLAHEERLLYLFIDIAGDGQEVTLEDIEDIGKDKKEAKRFNSEREMWVSDVEMESRMYKEKYRAAHATKASSLIIFAALTNVFFLFFMGILIETTHISYWLFLFPLFSILLMIGLVVYHVKRPSVTSEGDRVLKEWSGFRNMLLDVGNFSMREAGSIEVWGHYLVYAIALGVGDRVMEQLQVEYPVEELNDTGFGTYYYTNYLFVSILNRSVESGITSSSYTSNPGGTGGGFSGGSSGGTGGGSGGGAF